MKNELPGVFVVIDKPKGITSHDVIYRVRKITGVKKVGHAGTLDPMATGVLVVGIGRGATKRLSEHVRAEKEYVATVRLGAESDTGDAEGEISEREVKEVPREEEVSEALSEFIGIIDQVPPIYSAVKVEGRKAYELAREGKAVELKPRKREVKEIEILSYSWPELEVRVVTGKGVYIRALARDLGEKLGVGGYLTALKRTQVGNYTLADSMNFEELEQAWSDLQKQGGFLE